MNRAFRKTALRKIAMGFIAAITVTSMLPVEMASAATYKLTVTKKGSGSGVVTSSPASIDCGRTCSANVEAGTLVSLIATPSEGHEFEGWSGACSGTGGCIVEMNTTKTVTATFSAEPKILEVSKSGSGSVSSRPSGISCGTSCVKSFAVGTTVTLTASPSRGFLFNGWGGGVCSGKATTCTVSMTADRTVTATFLQQPVLSVTKSGSGTVTSNVGGIDCGRRCSATLATDARVTLTATPSSGNVFIGWSGGGCSGELRTCTITMDTSRGVNAVFSRSYALSVRKAGSGTGTVTSDLEDDAGKPRIDCGTKCSLSLPQNTVVSLYAEPTAGHEFGGWSGACTGNDEDDCQVTLSQARSVTATFVQVPYQLNVENSPAGKGRVYSNITGIDCGTKCEASVPGGVTMTLTAIPVAGMAFTGWSDGDGNPIDDCDDIGPCAVKMVDDTTVVANYEPGYALTVGKTGSGSGTVTSDPSGINCGPPCSTSFVSGEIVTLTAEPASNSEFIGFTGEGCVEDLVCTVDMDEARNVTANFALLPVTLSVSTTGSGYGTVVSNVGGIDCGSDCEADLEPGTQVQLTATADSGSIFRGWSGACSGTGTCTVSMSRARNVFANFDLIVTLSVSKIGTGSGTVNWNPGGTDCGVDCTRAFTSGSQVTLTAQPGANSAFNGWGGDCSGLAVVGSTCTLTLTSDSNVEVYFDLAFTLSVTKSGSGTVNSIDGAINCGSACSAKYSDSELVDLYAMPAPGYVVIWSGCEFSVGYSCSVTMDAAKSVRVVFAPQVTLSLTVTGPGSIVVEPLGSDCEFSCVLLVPQGTNVTLTAAAADGAEFVGWTGRCSSTILPTCTIPMNLARSVGAVFSR